MQMTVLSVKLPGQTNEQFVHEFRSVHAQSTIDMANDLGIISRYVQGLDLECVAAASPLVRMPLPEAPAHLASYAQLTWPSIRTLSGALKSSGYKNSAGKHVFANTAHVYMTDLIDEDATASVPRLWPVNAAEESPILLFVSVVPKEQMSDEEFRSAWNRHATKCRAMGVPYERHAVVNQTLQEAEKVLENTVFTASLCALRGGYEEFIFANYEAAQKFVDDHTEELKTSYASFTGSGSFCASFDRKMPYGEIDRGLKQQVMQKILGGVFGVTGALGVSV